MDLSTEDLDGQEGDPKDPEHGNGKAVEDVVASSGNGGVENIAYIEEAEAKDD